MKSLLKSPFGIAIAVFIFLLIVFFVFSIPMYDIELHYFSSDVDFIVKAKASLKQVIGLGVEDFKSNTLVPEINLTGKGIFILLILHFGLPALVYIRFLTAKQRNELNN